MNKEKPLGFINQQRKEHSGPMDAYRAGYFKCLDDFESKIQSDPEETCTYTRDEETNAWECSECGLTWVFMEDYTTPEENDMYYCPKCGRKIKVGE